MGSTGREETARSIFDEMKCVRSDPRISSISLNGYSDPSGDDAIASVEEAWNPSRSGPRRFARSLCGFEGRLSELVFVITNEVVADYTRRMRMRWSVGIESFGGVDIFGAAVHIQHIPRANAHQVDSFFGVDGNVTLFGGTRGRIFEVTGVLVGADIPGLLAAEALLLSYADGIARTLVDPIGRTFPNVYFQGEYVPSSEGPMWTDRGVCIPYRAVFYGLT
jgi:hypothetical protein